MPSRLLLIEFVFSSDEIVAGSIEATAEITLFEETEGTVISNTLLVALVNEPEVVVNVKPVPITVWVKLAKVAILLAQVPETGEPVNVPVEVTLTAVE